jgi:hypothetical protein
MNATQDCTPLDLFAVAKHKGKFMAEKFGFATI